MRIGGFQRLSLVDYPGKIAAVIFTQGCNFRCRYCHNASLVCPRSFNTLVDEGVVLSYLDARMQKIEGVVITGGEPTIQEGLLGFMTRIKQKGFLIKLDTNGTNPDMVRYAINLKLIDYIAMDVKTSWEKYDALANVKVNTAALKETLDIILSSKIPYQFRTTVVKQFCLEDDLNNIQGYIGSATAYRVQPFVESKQIIDPSVNKAPHYTPVEMESFIKRFERNF